MRRKGPTCSRQRLCPPKGPSRRDVVRFRRENVQFPGMLHVLGERIIHHPGKPGQPPYETRRLQATNHHAGNMGAIALMWHCG